MPSRPQAKSRLAGLLESAVRHPTTVFAVLVVAAMVGQALGILEPLDWWGNRTGR